MKLFRHACAPAIVAGALLAGVAGAEAKDALKGKASWYGPGFHGRLTANGERFNTHAMTAAHKTLPFGTRVRVTHAHTGRSVVVRINDRGPHVAGRVIDLLRAAAKSIAVSGVSPITLARL